MADGIKLTKKPKTFAAYSKGLEYFAESCQKQYVEGVERRDLLAFAAYLRDERELAPQTCHNRFRYVVSFLKWCNIQTPATPSGYSRFDPTNELVLRFPSSVRRSDAASLTIQDEDIRLISVHKFAKGEMKEALLPPTFRRSTPGVFNYIAADDAGV